MKKLISLFLIFSLVMLSTNLYAKERRGAKLIVTKLDGQQIRGELITVKPNSLLLLDTEGKDVSVDIEEIKGITILKESKAWTGALSGLIIGGVMGALLGTTTPPIDDWNESRWQKFWVILIALPSALIGGLIGAGVGRDETIQIEGMADLEIQETLDKLRKKARIRDYK
jgi:hypothetical protein